MDIHRANAVYYSASYTRASSKVGWCGVYTVQKLYIRVQIALQQAVKWREAKQAAAAHQLSTSIHSIHSLLYASKSCSEVKFVDIVENDSGKNFPAFNFCYI